MFNPVILGGLLIGSLTGYMLGLLAAPKRGSDTVKDLYDASQDLYRRAAYEVEDATARIDELVDDTANYLNALLQTLDPGPHESIKHAQESMAAAKKAEEQSTEVIHKAEAPTLTSQVEHGDQELTAESANELKGSLGAKVSTGNDSGMRDSA